MFLLDKPTVSRWVLSIMANSDICSSLFTDFDSFCNYKTLPQSEVDFPVLKIWNSQKWTQNNKNTFLYHMSYVWVQTIIYRLVKNCVSGFGCDPVQLYGDQNIRVQKCQFLSASLQFSARQNQRTQLEKSQFLVDEVQLPGPDQLREKLASTLPRVARGSRQWLVVCEFYVPNKLTKKNNFMKVSDFDPFYEWVK